MASTQDLLRQRFAELCAQRDEIAAKVDPLRAERHSIIVQSEEIAARAAPLDASIRELEKPLADLNNEIAQISVALNGQTAA